MNAAIATTAGILAAGAFLGAIGTTTALGIKTVRPRTGVIAIAGLVFLGAVMAGIAVGVSQ
ncbi:hypothetical protein [Curtobacterium sp. MCSS17_016]|uniref:hypothetical protein n=1 Tax=Curtobacterium sp. MCSS17_016 TaxID=2175644 RepID=UPI000DAABD99|nr:hypothetical protein [Curtobacterium sp. MCSS17_016]WIE81012.1 hypothetical protein DEJ19_021080 [Curtobacterium sp. MCSS17_016]